MSPDVEATTSTFVAGIGKHSILITCTCLGEWTSLGE